MTPTTPDWERRVAALWAELEALGLALGALAPHLPRYQRSLANYAAELHG